MPSRSPAGSHPAGLRRASSQSSSEATGDLARHRQIDATKANADGVVFCDRVQTLFAKFAGLNCTADATTGAVTCADPEELQLVLKSLNASSFNFAKTDVGTDVHTVTVQARAHAGVNFDDDASGGALAGAEAFAGAGSLAVDEPSSLPAAPTPGTE